MAEMLDIPVHSFRAPAPATDRPVSLEQILNDKQSQRLLIPAHQRTPGAWDRTKQSLYIQRLRQGEIGQHPPGSFATYQLVASEGGILRALTPTFLNDGLQRLTTLEALRANPTQFGMDSEGAEALLQLSISVQHRHYATHQEAMTDFQYINNGTHLTSYELCRGYLTYMPNWESWEPSITDIEAVIAASDRLVHRAVSRSREPEHKRRRDTLALFYRFLVRDKAHNQYPDISAKNIAKYLEKESVIEKRLADLMVSMGHATVTAQVKQFRAFIEAETALTETSVNKVLGPGRALSATSHRWLLHLAIWRRNNSVPREKHLRFVEIFLKETDGGSLWKVEGKHQVTIGLAHLGYLPALAEYAGMPEFCERQRREPGKKLRAGFDNSHVLPYATHGDGPTFPEPAPTNRSRGARPVELPTEESES